LNDNADLPDSNLESKVWEIQKILPGYPGVATPDDRRTCDEAVRRHTFTVADRFLHHVASLEAYLAQHGEGDTRTQAAEAVGQIEMLIDKMQSTPYTFSPFFTFDRVPEDLQLRVLENDENTLRVVGRVEALLAPTLEADTDFDAVLTSVFQLVADLDTQLETRINTIMEFH